MQTKTKTRKRKEEVSSNNNSYQTEKLPNGACTCTCQAWKFSKTKRCKHMVSKGFITEEQLKEEKQKKKQKKEKPSTPMPLLLAHPWNPEKINPKGYWMSQKLDGIRAYWNGAQFLSRLGNPFDVPQSIVDSMPSDLILDGELYTRPKDFSNIVSIVKTMGLDLKAWEPVKYHVFDILTPTAKTKPFEQRLQLLKDDKRLQEHSFIKLVAHEPCQGQEHLMKQMKMIVEQQNGEGVMLREPGSMYVEKRSKTLLKVKPFLEMDVVVVGHVKGKGKHSSRLGALQVKTRTDPVVEFRVGSGFKDKDRSTPPAIGSIVTVRYNELIPKTGKPRFPIFAGERIDLK